MEQTDDAVVRYGVKELLALQGETLKRVESKIDAGTLAQADINAKLDTRVSLLEAKEDLTPRVEVLEQQVNQGIGASELLKVVIPILLTAALLAVAVLGLIHKL